MLRSPPATTGARAAHFPPPARRPRLPRPLAHRHLPVGAARIAV